MAHKRRLLLHGGGRQSGEVGNQASPPIAALIPPR